MASGDTDVRKGRKNGMAVKSKRTTGKWLTVSGVAVTAAFGLWIWLSVAVLAEESGAVENSGDVAEAAIGDAQLEAVPAEAGQPSSAERISPPDNARLLVQVRGGSALAKGTDLAGLNGVHIAAGRMFSLRSLIGEGTGEQWSYPASLLHEAAVKAGLGTAERHIGLVLADGIAPGFEALMDGTNRDLQIYNDLSFDVWVEAEADASGKPVIRFLGEPPDGWQPPVIRVETETFAADTLLMANGHSMRSYKPAWTSRDGLLAKVYRDDGERVLLYKDFYPALPKVEIH